ncbi:MAG: DNA polymerase/3'-5' exonuclease PolX [Anaerolineales bacterium]
MTNKELAEIFATIANLLEIKGEVIYKILAYRRASETFREHPRAIRDVWREGKLREVPNVGPAIAEKVEELLTTSQLGFFEKLKSEVPLSLAEMLAVPDLGPKRVAIIWKKLNLTTLTELETAARTGKLRNLAGFGEKTEAIILIGIEARKLATGRMPLGQAWPVAQDILKYLRVLPGVRAAEVAGSLRRMRPTIGDLDFLVAADEARSVMAAFVTHPQVARVLGQGPTKTSVELDLGLQADLRVLSPERFGTLLQYFTGSKDHNVKIRELALQQGLSLNEHAFTQKNGEEILCATEADVYKTLGLAYIPPEMREDRGEIQAARENKLPRLLETRELQSDLHSHTVWSDGQLAIREMAYAARSRGLRCLAITDHSQSLGVANGLSVERVRQQRKEIDGVQAELGTGFSLLHGSEVEIRADGALDYGDDVLEDLDIVVASLHTSLRQEREKITARLIHAIQNRHVDIIGHPTGRMLPDRDGADLDMEAVLRAAAENGVALEVNANPQRLDLDGVYVKRALELGCVLAIDTDAHHPDHFNFAHFGVGTARRGWATTEDVINCWPVERLLQWLDDRGHRRPRVNHHIPEIMPVAEVKPPTIEQKAPPRKSAARKTPVRNAPPKKAANRIAVRSAPKKPTKRSASKKTSTAQRRKR